MRRFLHRLLDACGGATNKKDRTEGKHCPDTKNDGQSVHFSFKRSSLLVDTPGYPPGDARLNDGSMLCKRVAAAEQYFVDQAGGLGQLPFERGTYFLRRCGIASCNR